MIDAIVVFCSCANEAEADRIAAGLVEERLAACVTLLPQVKSVYRWRGQVEKSREALLVIKAVRQNFGALRDHILSAHSYETPEILALSVTAGSEQYLQWIAAESVETAEQ